MDRREALRRMSLLFGGAIIGSQLFMTGCSRTASPQVAELFTDEKIDFIGDIAEGILPQTATPGAKEAGVGSVMPVIVRDCYTEEDQKVFLAGLESVEAKAKEVHGVGFQALTPEQRTELLREIDKERLEYDKTKTGEMPAHYFTMLRQLTLLGFFSSEIGATQSLRYVAIPGKYDGNLPYKKGDRAWAT